MFGVIIVFVPDISADLYVHRTGTSYCENGRCVILIMRNMFRNELTRELHILG